MNDSYLVLFDADRIKDYVFATGRLKEIRGASAIVRDLTDAPVDMLKDAGWNPTDAPRLIYAGGGAGALQFAQLADAESFCRALEQQYRRTTGGATLSAVCEPVHGNGPAAEAEAQTRAARALARRKASRPVAEELPAGTLLRFCASDRLRPASLAVADPDGRQMLVSRSTAAKHTASHQERSKLVQTPFWKAFRDAVRAKNPSADLAAWQAAPYDSQDLGTIAAQSHPAGYVALVYADGDGVGGQIRDIAAREGFAGYAALSRALEAAAGKATAQALAGAYAAHAPRPQRLPNGRRRPCLPFEVVTIGGDDVILICTAEYGIQIACELSKAFGDQLEQELANQNLTLDAPITASVGVIIAHAGVPIVQLEQRGRDLLKSAKQASGDGEGGIDFHIATTPSLDGIDVVRRRDYQPSPSLKLTMRPFRRSQLQQLMTHARRLASGPAALSGSKRADLYFACQGQRAQATLDVLAVHSRLAEAQRGELLTTLAACGCLELYPFSRADAQGHQHTVLLDLLELVAFAGNEGGWE